METRIPIWASEICSEEGETYPQSHEFQVSAFRRAYRKGQKELTDFHRHVQTVRTICAQPESNDGFK